MDTLPIKPQSSNGPRRRRDRNSQRKQGGKNLELESHFEDHEEGPSKAQIRREDRQRNTPQSHRQTSENCNGATNYVADTSLGRPGSSQASSSSAYHSHELDDQTVIEWLSRTPKATTADCIRQFRPYLPDENAKKRFSGLIKKVADLNGRFLSLKEVYYHEKEARSKEGKGREVRNEECFPVRKRRRRSRSASPSGRGDESKVSTFEEGDDFIPLPVSPPPSPVEKDYGGRDRRMERRRDGDTSRDWDGARDKRESKRSKGREFDREKQWERERSPSPVPRDKGKGRAPDSNRQNGKYESGFELNDGNANKRQRMDATSRKAPWVSEVDWESCHNVAEMLHREVEAFIHYISPSPIEHEVRGFIVELVSKTITQAFPDAEVHPFGSYATKLYLPKGDIDLVCLSQSMAYSKNASVLHRLASTLKRANITSKVTIIAHAKVPIVKFVTTHGHLKVDISVNQPNGTIAAQVVNGFLTQMHGGGMALRALIMIVKAFLNQRSMNEVFTGGLGSYSIVLLAVSFLQMHPKIRRGEIDPEKNLGVLVMEFFELYGHYFNYDEVGISVQDGGTYFNKHQRGWVDWKKSNLLSIEDPIDPSNDISKGSYKIQNVRTAFAGAHGILSATAFLRAGMITARRRGHSHSLRRHHHPEDMSMLSSIVGVTQDLIHHRSVLREVYEKQTLQRLVGVQARNGPGKADSGSKFVRATHLTEGQTNASAEEVQSVHSAWKEAEMGLENDEDHRKGRNRGRKEDDEVETSRYDIEQRSRKRRKTGSRANGQPTTMVFTTDDDGDEDGLIVTAVDSMDEEEREYDLRLDNDEGKRSRESKSRAVSPDRKRSFWLSKGIGGDSDGSG